MFMISPVQDHPIRGLVTPCSINAIRCILRTGRVGKAAQPSFMEMPGPHPTADEHVVWEIDPDDLVQNTRGAWGREVRSVTSLPSHLGLVSLGKHLVVCFVSSAPENRGYGVRKGVAREGLPNQIALLRRGDEVPIYLSFIILSSCAM